MRDDRERENDPLLFLALFLSLSAVLTIKLSNTTTTTTRISEKKGRRRRAFYGEKKILFRVYSI
jgi:hypothetical protein